MTYKRQSETWSVKWGGRVAIGGVVDDLIDMPRNRMED